MNYKNYKYFHQNSKSGVPDQKQEVHSSVGSIKQLTTSATRRGNSISSMNFPNLNNFNNFSPQVVNEVKTTKVNPVAMNGINGTNNRTIRKDVIKLYENNLKGKTKNDSTPSASTPVSKSNKKIFYINFYIGPIPLTQSSFNLFQSKEITFKVKPQSPNMFSKPTSRSPINKPNRTTDIMIQTKQENSMNANSANTHTNISTKTNVLQSSLNANNNVNVYNELAKKLKNNKGIIKNKGYFTTNSNDKSNNEVSNLKTSISGSTNLKILKTNIKEYSSNLDGNKNVTQNSLNQSSNYNSAFNSALNSAMNTATKFQPTKEFFNKEKITTLGITNKTTKDISTSGNTSSTLRMFKETNGTTRFSTNTTSDIEGPEELHMFYVNIFQNNKKLAFKFEGSNTKFDEINYEL